MELKIIYYKSSSKYYDSVCLQCEKFDKFTYNVKENILIINESEIKNKISNLTSILEIIKNWTKTEFYINNKKVSIYNIYDLIDIIKCDQNYNDEDKQIEYCYQNAGWGCRFLDSIFLRKEPYRGYYSRNNYWFDYGYFEDKTWIIDKKSIKEKIYKEIQEKNIEVCIHFDIQKIKEAINLLPDKIEITNDENCKWEYRYRESPVGLMQTEIIGIKPKEEKSNFSFSLFSKQSNEIESEGNIVKEKNVPSITFNDIGGIEDIIQQVREVIELPLVAPEIFKHYAIKPHKGILLYGPPGCGKTLIAKAIANEINAHFILVNGPEILNKFLGQSEENIRNIFDEARKNTPSIIYFDEFDSISMSRDNENNPHLAPVVNQLLTLMDGVDNNDKLCVIASTNRVDIIDEALKRPGRFDYVIEVKKPSPEGCKKIFRIHTQNMPIEDSFNKDMFVEQYLLGLSGAEIAFVAIESAYNSIRRTINTKKVLDEKDTEYKIDSKNIIIEEDFKRAVHTLKVNRRDI